MLSGELKFFIILLKTFQVRLRVVRERELLSAGDGFGAPVEVACIYGDSGFLYRLSQVLHEEDLAPAVGEDEASAPDVSERMVMPRHLFQERDHDAKLIVESAKPKHFREKKLIIFVKSNPVGLPPS